MKKKPAKGKTFAIFSILADKDIDGVVKPLLSLIDEWHVSGVKSQRTLSSQQIVTRINSLNLTVNATDSTNEGVHIHPHVQDASRYVQASASHKDSIIAFGSFWVAAEIIAIQPEQSVNYMNNTKSLETKK